MTDNREQLRTAILDAAVAARIMISNGGKGIAAMPTADVDRIDRFADEVVTALFDVYGSEVIETRASNNPKVIEEGRTDNIEVIPAEAMERLAVAERGIVRPVHWKDAALTARRSDIRWALAEIARLRKELYE